MLFTTRSVPLYCYYSKLSCLSLAFYSAICILFCFLRFYLFLEREGGKKRGRKTSMYKRYINRLPLALPQLGAWPTTQACALTRNRTGNLLVHRRAMNQNPIQWVTPARAAICILGSNCKVPRKVLLRFNLKLNQIYC